MNAHIGFQPFTWAVPVFLEIEISLEPHPEGLGGSQEAGQAQRSFSGEGAGLLEQLLYELEHPLTDILAEAMLAQVVHYA